MSSQYRRRVGSVRPSHLMFTTGVGALVDLPNFAVLIKGLDDWRYDNVPEWEPIPEPRLLAGVRLLRGTRRVEQLRPAPWMPGLDAEPNGPASRVGVPTMPFPAWLRCTACNELAPIDSQVFGFENDKPSRPYDARFFHDSCGRKNRQEIRHATYWGDFISCMEELGRRPFWVNSGIFSSNDIRRMKDVEYVSELAIGILFGPQNKKSNLDTYYASFEEEFPDRTIVEATFSAVIGELEQLITWPNKLRWSRKVDFYSLFLALAARVAQLPFDRTERERVSNRLVDFSGAVNRLVSLTDARESDFENIDKRALAYARSVRNSSDLGSRRTRLAALDAYLQGKPMSFEPTPSKGRDPLRSLPSAEILMSQVGDATANAEPDIDGEVG